VTRDVRRSLQVVLGPGGHVPDDEFLGHPPAEQHVEPVEQLGPRHQITVLGRSLLRVLERRHPARDDRDLGDAIRVGPGLGD
jgi:hypothetical protein